MKYEQWKQLNKQEQEEYNYKFKGIKFIYIPYIIGWLCIVIIGIMRMLVEPTEISNYANSIVYVFFLFMLLLIIDVFIIINKKTKWLKSKFKEVRK